MSPRRKGPTRVERSPILADRVQRALEIIRSHFAHVVLDQHPGIFYVAGDGMNNTGRPHPPRTLATESEKTQDVRSLGLGIKTAS
mgnify:CR=1 FL=1